MSRYIIESDENSFLVRGRPLEGLPEWLIEAAYEALRLRREPVRAVQEPYCLHVEAVSKKLFFNFFEFRLFVGCIADGLMILWDRPHPPEDVLYDDEGDAKWARPWATKQAERAINSRVHAEWQRLLGRVDGTVLAVHRKVFAATYGFGGLSPLLSDEKLYRETFIVKDILAYRAAAVAARFCDYLGGQDDRLAAMSNWRSLFAPKGGGSYTSLDKTLMNLPGGVSAGVLRWLPRVVLPRPIYNRLELITTIVAGTRSPRNYRVFAHAREDEIAEAIRRIGNYLHHELTPRRWHDVRKAILFMLDYPEQHNGRIVGLAEKSIRWHREDYRAAAEKDVVQLGRETEVAKPPIPLPQIEGIRFLATVGDVADEGYRMEHCIGTYARRAVQGECYLFHADYLGEEASVEVSPYGAVVQAQGPHNSRNNAARRAERVLAQWGRAMYSLLAR